MNLSAFKQHSFINALKHLFTEQLNVPVNFITDEAAMPVDVLGETYNPDNKTHQLINEVYIMGIVDDAAFEGTKGLEDPKALTKDYEGILILGVTLDLKDNGAPTRTQLAEITRAFNREFKYMPVVVVFKYAQCLALANTERL